MCRAWLHLHASCVYSSHISSREASSVHIVECRQFTNPGRRKPRPDHVAWRARPPPYPPKKYTLASPRSRNGSKILVFVAAVAVAVDGPLIEEDERARALKPLFRTGYMSAGVNCFSVQIFSAPIKKHVRSLLPYNLIHAVVIPKIMSLHRLHLRFEAR